MFVVTLEVELKSGTEQVEVAGGAYAVCWIDFQLQDGAEHLAKFYVEQGGWISKTIKNVSKVKKKYYEKEYHGEEREQLIQYFAEAKKDGVCIVFHAWSSDAEDAQVDDGEW